MHTRSLTLLTLALLALPAMAQATWPTKPVHIIVGFAGGSSPDISARALADALGKTLGQPVIVDNKPGASGNIAADMVAKATDDHTLGVVINGNLTSAKMLAPQLPFDPAQDFAYLSLLTTAPLVLVAPANLPGGKAFFDAARQGAGSWNYGSPGNGTLAHLGMEWLVSQVPGMAPVHIPFQGNPQAVTALLGSQIQMALVPPGLAMSQVAAGKLRAIGLAGSRSALVPDVPSLAEAGVRGVNLEVWTALVGPARLSPAAQTRLATEIARIYRDPEVRAKLFHQGWQAVGSAPEGLRGRVQDEMGLMRGLIAARGIRLE
nr:tripartite tricarboxylate transporter substrate-binding protein [uncultured Albidiferax sp.]